jgi:ring-1,2-phenylacetyl-CoA epoxidase subunit PaaD
MAATETPAMAATDEARAEAQSRPSIAELWLALGTVPDPEIPVVSVVELGILRGIEWDAADPTTLVVTVTPTYSGCPATELIVASIREALAAAGAARVRLETELAPPWTTDWITAEGRRKLRAVAATAAMGVTGFRPLRRAVAAVACPRCASLRTSLLSQFGSTACKAQYRCLDCLEPFDYFKPH